MGAILLTVITLGAFIAWPLVDSLIAPTRSSPGPAPPGAITSVHNSKTARIHQIEVEAAGIRRLRPLRPVHAVLLGNKAFDHEIASTYRQGNSRHDLDISHVEAVMIGLIRPSVNLMRLLTHGLTQEVVGLYDKGTKKLFIRNNGNALGIDRWTIAHEFTHALQDQHFHLKRVQPSQAHWSQRNSDAALAEHSLIEGDAVHVQYAYLQDYYAASEVAALQRELSAYHTAPVPPLINEQFQFPYTDGLSYVNYLLARGGYAAVNRAFLHPPSSTFEIMFPGARIWPVPMHLHHVLGAFRTWKIEDNDVNGAFGYYQLAEQHASHQASIRLAALWRGDRYLLLRSGKRYGMYLRSVYQNPHSALEAAAIVRLSLAHRFHQSVNRFSVRDWMGSGHTFAAVAVTGRRVDLAYAPTAILAKTLAVAPAN